MMHNIHSGNPSNNLSDCLIPCIKCIPMQPEVLHEGCFSGKQHQVEEQKDCTDICQHFIKNFEL